MFSLAKIFVSFVLGMLGGITIGLIDPLYDAYSINLFTKCYKYIEICHSRGGVSLLHKHNEGIQ